MDYTINGLACSSVNMEDEICRKTSQKMSRLRKRRYQAFMESEFPPCEKNQKNESED